MITIKCTFISNKGISLEAAKNHKPYTFNTQDDLQPGDIISVKEYNMLLMVVAIYKKNYTHYGNEGLLGASFTPLTPFKITELTESQNADFGMKYKSVK